MRRADVRRDEVFLTTKVLPEQFAPDAFIAVADASLERLGTDYIDLLLLHWPSKEVPIADTIGALNKLFDSGKARHGGVSNFTMEMVDQAQGKVMGDATLQDIAATHDANPAQIALAWILTRPMGIANPRTCNKQRIAGNLAAAERYSARWRHERFYSTRQAPAYRLRFLRA